MNTFKRTYKNEDLTVYSANKIAISFTKNIKLYGVDPIIHPLSEEEQKNTTFNIPFAAILVQKWGYGFYHFVNEMLPKIIRIFEYNSKIPIIIFYNETFIKSILTYIGITNPIIPYNGTPQYMIKNAILMTETRSGNPTPSDIDVIRKYIRLNNTVKDTIVFIYRKERLRSISNFDKVYDELNIRFPKEQFVIFDSLPFDKTVQLFQKAKLIIGAHGAGLSNMIFGTKKTPVIEIFPVDIANMCYWHLSWILENPHYILASESSGPPALNITINIEELCNLISRLV